MTEDELRVFMISWWRSNEAEARQLGLPAPPPWIGAYMSADELRSVGARARRMIFGGFLAVAVVLLVVLGIARLHELGPDPAAHLDDPPVRTAVILVHLGAGALVVGALAPRAARIEAQRRLDAARTASGHVLAPGERLDLLCPVRFLEGSRLVPGFLLVSEGRVVRLDRRRRWFRRSPWSWSAAELCALGELERVELTRRHAAQGVRGAVIEALGQEQGLWLRASAGRRWFVDTDTDVVRALWRWFGLLGVPLGERNDADLIAPEAPTPVLLAPLRLPEG